MNHLPSQRLHQLLMEGIDFQKLMNLSEILLKNPVSCSDSSFHHRALSPGYPQKDISERAHYRSISTAEEYMENTILPYRAIDDNTPFILHTPGARRRIICKSYISGRHVGHIAVPECSRPLEEMDYDLIRLISDMCALCYVLQVGSSDLTHATDPEQSIFETLVSGEFKSEEDFRIRARHYIFDKPLEYCVVLASFPPQHSKTAPIMLKHSAIRSGSGWTLNRNEECILLCAWDNSRLCFEKFTEEVRGLCERYEMTALFSDIYTNPIETQRWVRNVSFLGKHIKEKSTGVFFYNDYKVELAIKTLMDQGWSKNELSLSQFTYLMEEDKENGSDLASTLLEYLYSGKSITKTAEHMFVHKNTILYRLKKIEDITGLNPNDPALALSVLFSGKVLEAGKNKV